MRVVDPTKDNEYTNNIYYRRTLPITVKPVYNSGTLINSAVANCLFKQQ